MAESLLWAVLLSALFHNDALKDLKWLDTLRSNGRNVAKLPAAIARLCSTADHMAKLVVVSVSS